MTTPPATGSGGCPECGERFATTEDLYRHRKTHPKPHEGLSTGAVIPLVCPECGERFDNDGDLYRHRETHPESSVGLWPALRPALRTLGIVLLVIVALLIIGGGICAAILSGAY